MIFSFWQCLYFVKIAQLVLIGICIVDENASIFIADKKTLLFLCSLYCEQSLLVNSYNNADEKKLSKVM